MKTTRRPSLGLFMLEGQRALLEGSMLPPAAPLLRLAPRGDGQPVLVLPGLMAGDGSTAMLRHYLNSQGFSAHPWKLGRNFGPQNGIREALGLRLARLQRRSGRRVSIVGWSLGGIYARELAKQAPEAVRQVISLGSPFGDVGQPSNATRVFDFVSRKSQEPSRAAMASDIRQPPDLPSTAIYSKTDGVVHWQTCLEPDTDHTENIEVSGSHCGLGINPLVLYAVAERLSQPEGGWQPFAIEGWRRFAFK